LFSSRIRRDRSSYALRPAPSQEPLLRAGLALTGANERRNGGDDGILTALEVAGLDLTGTKLVVLSACNSALSATRGGGIGVLQRALVLAGAQSQVMALWSVDDGATRDLMTEYYRRLATGGGRSDALREAALSLLGRPETAHPYYWAAFIAAGDPRSLDDKPPPAVRAWAHH
jgi:CHAT domain-containing protein